MGHPDPLGQYIVSEYLEDPLAMAQRSTRSSSEEKDAITPAQSRRKAQNRAAYVSCFFFSLPAAILAQFRVKVQEEMLTISADNGPFGNEKNDESKNSSRN